MIRKIRARPRFGDSVAREAGGWREGFRRYKVERARSVRRKAALLFDAAATSTHVHIDFRSNRYRDEEDVTIRTRRDRVHESAYSVKTDEISRYTYMYREERGEMAQKIEIIFGWGKMEHPKIIGNLYVYVLYLYMFTYIYIHTYIYIYAHTRELSNLRQLMRTRTIVICGFYWLSIRRIV